MTFEGLYLPAGRQRQPADYSFIINHMAVRLDKVEDRLTKLERKIDLWLTQPDEQLALTQKRAKEAMEKLGEIKKAIEDANDALSYINAPNDEW